MKRSLIKIFLSVFFLNIYSFLIYNFSYTSPTIYTTEQTLSTATHISDFYWYQDGIALDPGAYVYISTPCSIDSASGVTGIRGDNNAFLYINSNLHLGQGAVISGLRLDVLTDTLRSYFLILEGDVTVANNPTFYNIATNGNGYKFDFNGTIVNYGDIFFKNVRMKHFSGTGTNCCLIGSGCMYLENSIINVSGTADFLYGRTDFITVVGDVVIRSEGNQVNIVSPILVMPNSRLYFDKGTVINLNNANAAIILSDSTSSLYIDGCSINFTSTSLTFTSGTVYFDNRVKLNGSYGMQFLGGASAKFLSGVKVDMLGYFTFNF